MRQQALQGLISLYIAATALAAGSAVRFAAANLMFHMAPPILAGKSAAASLGTRVALHRDGFTTGCTLCLSAAL